MSKIDDIRAMSPAYADLSDDEIADRLYQSKYAGKLTREEFNQRMGIAQPSQAADIGRGALRGLLGAIEAPVGMMGELEQAEAMGRIVPWGQPPQREPAPAPSVAPSLTQAIPAPKSFLGRTTETAANIAPLAAMSPGSVLQRAVGAAGQALGSETAGTAAEAVDPDWGPYGRFAGGLIGAVTAGLAASERGLAALRGKLPTNKQIADEVDAGYKSLRESNARISEVGSIQLWDHVEATVRADVHPELADKTYKIIQDLAPGGERTVADIDATRRALNSIKPTAPLNEYPAARSAVRGIDEWLSNIPDQFVMSGDPARDAAILRSAQRNHAIRRQLDDVEEATARAQRRAATSPSAAARIERAREQIRTVLESEKKSRGMSPEVREQVERIVLGTALSNWALRLARFAPETPTAALFTIATDIAVGRVYAAAVAMSGFIAKYLGEYLTDRQIAQLEQLMRAESPLGAPVAQQMAPQMAEQAMIPSVAAARALVTGAPSPLAPQQ
jgi:hypothetical protein